MNHINRKTAYCEFGPKLPRSQSEEGNQFTLSNNAVQNGGH